MKRNFHIVNCLYFAIFSGRNICIVPKANARQFFAFLRHEIILTALIGMVGVSMGNHHRIETADAALPKIGRDHVLAGVELRMHPLRRAALRAKGLECAMPAVVR